MASFPEHLFALPFLFPAWLALVLWVGSTLTLRAARVTGG